jgi:hypothetical protein
MFLRVPTVAMVNRGIRWSTWLLDSALSGLRVLEFSFDNR